MKLTKEKIEKIDHCISLISHVSEEIQNLCSSEKDDIVIRFELGTLYKALRECNYDLMEVIE